MTTHDLARDGPAWAKAPPSPPARKTGIRIPLSLRWHLMLHQL